jgi:hypothetical protein
MKATRQLQDLGQSLWLDNITRRLLADGTLQRYISEFSVTGLTSNPTIFAFGEERRLAPRHQRVESLLGLALLRRVFRVHVDAVRAAVQLRGPQLHQLQQRPFEPAMPHVLLEPAHRRVAPGATFAYSIRESMDMSLSLLQRPRAPSAADEPCRIRGRRMTLALHVLRISSPSQSQRGRDHTPR